MPENNIAPDFFDIFTLEEVRKAEDTPVETIDSEMFSLSEEEIDIQAVMQEIKSLEAKRAELDQEIDVYFKELGLVF